MCVRQEFSPFEQRAFHKGFYNDEDAINSLDGISYSDFFTEPDDNSFPYGSASSLLCGACHFFALSLNKILKYNIYIIEGNNKKSFHAFCQVYKAGKWYYIDARGVTSSFDEFMVVAKKFVTDEYIIRPVLEEDIFEWKTDKDDEYRKEACEFAETIIEKYKECYTI